MISPPSAPVDLLLSTSYNESRDARSSSPLLDQFIQAEGGGGGGGASSLHHVSELFGLTPLQVSFLIPDFGRLYYYLYATTLTI